MPTITWSNEKSDHAKTWEELETAVRLDQWWALDPDEFRQEMAKRAQRWSGTEIVTAGSSEQFLRELERAKLVRIETDDDDEKED